MADERDAWLDKDAAERLLRGEPVEAMDKDVLAGSERLAGALRDIAAIAYANGTELPGEAAALAAFRRAGAPEEDSASAPGAADGVLGTVRLALAPRAVSRSRTGRPVRRGFAVAVAGCALGGIAVAAGAGVMPPLFAGEENPVPANSISSLVTPRPYVSNSSADARGTGGPSGGPGADGGEQPMPHPSSEDGAGVAGGADADGARDHAAHAGHGGQGGQGDDDRSFTVASGDKASAFYRKTLDACRDLRRGTIDEARRQVLEAAAEGPQEAERFCARLLDGRDGNKGGPGDNDGNGDGNGSIRNGDADGGGGTGGKDDGGGGHGNPGGDGNGDGAPEGPTLGDPSPYAS
ncbi:hypothetical protein, partial [Streptomyces odonnellii]|uniref:hypothetical protein n=1 Tax=Streptomyces odonnellii TaxID=1417980 RepID=UPI00062525AE